MARLLNVYRLTQDGTDRRRRLQLLTSVDLPGYDAPARSKVTKTKKGSAII